MSSSLPGLAGAPAAERCLVMGVVNVTPDSFSDGGLWFDRDRAIAHGLDLMAAGADLLDVGGESTRPGSVQIDEAEELRRVVPVITALAGAGAPVSVDTTRAAVADAALVAGAVMVNDVSGGRADPGLIEVVRAARVPYVAMHWRGRSDVMDSLAVYDDVVAEVCAELKERLDTLLEKGIDADRIVLDPGFGFAKLAEHNWILLGGLDRVVALGVPVLIGTSRKRFLAQAVPPDTREANVPAARDDATTATTVLAAQAGVWAVRVHDVLSSAAAVRVVSAVGRAGGTQGGTAE